CPSGQSISRIVSEHHNKHEDRLWDFGCKARLDSATNCFTSSHVNDFDKPFNYQCPSHQVITGMNSYHENRHENRTWKFTFESVHENKHEDLRWKYQYWAERSC
uniref:Uncharacterized protein n=1 Tax=Oncorhynchus mykiss TaxID=8022 RepID=A0A8C7NZS8_ONCMY